LSTNKKRLTDGVNRDIVFLAIVHYIQFRGNFMSNPSGFRARMKYRFDNFMSRGGFSIFMALLFLFVISFVVMGVVRYVINLVFPDETIGSLSDQLWRVFLQISDAGAVAEDGDNTVWNKAVGIVTIFLGLVLFSSLVAFITSQFEAKLDELKKGKSRVIEKDHTLILGFGDRVLEIIRELIIANESERDAAIVVLSQNEKDEMDDFFRERIEDTQTTRIITRSGVTSSLQTLDKVSINEAKSIVILNDVEPDADEVEKELGDARVLKTIMAVISCTGEDQMPPVVAELHMPNKRRLARKISPMVTVIEEHTILAKLMVQTSRISGLALVYDNLVGFDGCEFYYYRPKEGWGNKTYGVVQLFFYTCSVIGVRTVTGEVLINPEASYKLPEDSEVLLIAEDDSTIKYAKQALKINPIKAEPGAPLPKKEEHQLIIGWSKKTSIIVEEFSDYLIDGSQIYVLVPESTDEMNSQLTAIQKKHKGIKMKLIKGDIHHEDVLKKLKPETFDNIIILKEDGGDSELRDSETIATLLEFRHYFKTLGDVEIQTQLVSEVADSENINVIQEVGVKDFLISNKFVSKIYAQVSEDPDVLKAYDELFKEEGSEIYIKPINLFIKELAPEITFGDLCAAAIKRNESCFGVRIQSEEMDEDKNYGIYINPPKDQKFKLTVEDFLITLAEDET